MNQGRVRKLNRLLSFSCNIVYTLPIQEAARSKAYIGGLFVAVIAGSNPAEGMDVCILCLYAVLSCVGRGLCDGLITRQEESYHVSVCV
jgi:hypothetical protein